ncbi:MAG: MFS transporter [Gemmatimonadetes bacterium]|nr:MFS transporter [Gemmatimonadota bacterium]
MSSKNIFGNALPARVPFYYGWVVLIFAAVAMVATLPGRSVGIGLITEPLIADLGISRLDFARMNFWATIFGALFNLVCGITIDRFGVRAVVTAVLFVLSAVVLGFSQVAGAGFLLLLLVLMRGVGQSALSVVSLTMVGKWFVRRLSVAMGIFAVLMSLGFAVAIVVAGDVVLKQGWRVMWSGLGWILMVLSGLCLLFGRRDPEAVGLDTEVVKGDESQEPVIGFTLVQALMTPAFYVFAVGSALYNLVIAGVMLFNQSILGELGFDETVFQYAMAVFMATGLLGNFTAGWAARRWSLGRLMTIAMLAVGVYLLAFPQLKTPGQALVHAGLLGFSGGVVSVIFFTAWADIFGRLHLGKIQGAAQVFAVLASATGPLFIESVFSSAGTYAPAFYALAPAVLLVAIFAYFVNIPRPEDAGIKRVCV